jgi:hypothetical protein
MSDAEPKATEGSTTTSPLSRALALVTEVGSWFYPVTVATLYVSGFLVLNANLSKYGIIDAEFVDARYFLAGASFALYLVCFYLFAGRAAVLGPRWLSEEVELSKRIGVGRLGRWVLSVHSFVDITFFCCLSAALFTTFAIDAAATAIFWAALAGGFLILFPLDVTNLDVKFFPYIEVVKIIVKLPAIYVFFRYGESVLRTVFFTYVGIFMFINFVLDHLTRYKRSADKLVFSGVHAAVVLIGTAVTFGTLLYGQVMPKVGGAKPKTVSIALPKEVREALPTSIALEDTQLLVGQLIHETTGDIYVEASGRTVRLRKGDVISLIIVPEPERQFWKEFLEPKPDASKINQEKADKTKQQP